MTRHVLSLEEVSVETFETGADESFASIQPVGGETPHPGCEDSPLCGPTFWKTCE